MPKISDGVDFSACLATRLDSRVSLSEGMTSLNERRFLQWYAEKIFSGAGDLVDLGSWFGSSVISMAAGLAARDPLRPGGGRKIQAFDAFVWEDWMARYVREPTRYKAGSSFLAEFRKATAPWKGLIAERPADLSRATWDGGPIELLFVDAMKSWELGRAIALNFFPSLIPGNSLIVHQDYKHFYCPWIHLMMYRLRDRCRPVYDLPQSGSVVFSVVGPLDRKDCATACDFSSYTLGEIEDAFRYSKEICSTKERLEISAANIMLFVHLARNEFHRTGAQKKEASKGLLAVSRCLNL